MRAVERLAGEDGAVVGLARTGVVVGLARAGVGVGLARVSVGGDGKIAGTVTGVVACCIAGT